jgi:hypothetical protein
MNHLVVNGELLAELQRQTSLVEIRESTGKTVGYYAPTALPDAKTIVQSAAATDWDDLYRRKVQQLPGYSTREVFEHLLSLSEAEQEDLRKRIAELKEQEKCASQ